MKLVVSKKLSRRILQWLQGMLIAGAIAMLGYCGFVLTDTWVFQTRERSHLQRLLNVQPEAKARTPSRAFTSTNNLTVPAGRLIGQIQIPRIGISAIVIEGINGKILGRAVGHVPGTSLPGQPGNAGISGHRDTFFRSLRNIRQSDVIVLTTPHGEYRYRVVSMKIVRPNDVGVLDSSDNEILTLVTCYPFYFVGPAPDRFIVRAERIIGQS